MTNSDLVLETDVYEWLGRKRKSLWRLRKEYKFPQPVLKYPTKYRKSETQEWLDNGGIN